MNKEISILMVDDTRDILSVYPEYLEMSGGFKVDTAGSPEEGVEKVRENPGRYHFCLMDYRFNGTSEINGIEATRQLKALDPSLIVILFSNHSEVVDMKLESAAKEAGAHSFQVKKPVQDIPPFMERLADELIFTAELKQKKTEMGNFYPLDNIETEVFRDLSNILEDVKKDTAADIVFIRYKEKKALVLGPLLGGYFPVSLRSLDLESHHHFPSVRAFKENTPVVIDDIHDENESPEIEAFYPVNQKEQWKKLHSTACYPIVSEKEKMGVLSLLSYEVGFFPRKRKQIDSIIETHKQKIGAAINNFLQFIELIERLVEMEEKNTQLETLQKLSGTETINLPPEEYMQRACALIKEVLDARICSIYLWDREWGRLKLKATTCGGFPSPDRSFYYTKGDKKIWELFCGKEAAYTHWEGSPSRESPGYLFNNHCGQCPGEEKDRTPRKAWYFPLIRGSLSPGDKTPNLGLIEVLDKLDSGTEKETAFFEELGTAISTWVHNWQLVEQDRKINRMMSTLSLIYQFIPEAKTIDELCYLFLLAVTHREGLKHNRAFLFLPPRGSVELRLQAAVGIRTKEEATSHWPTIKGLEKLLNQFRDTGQIPAGAMWPPEETAKISIDPRGSCLFEKIFREKSTVTYSGVRVINITDKKEEFTVQDRLLVKFLSTDNTCLINEITIARVNLGPDRQGFLLVDNMFNDRKNGEIDYYLLEQYAHTLSAALQKFLSTQGFKEYTAELAHELRNIFQSVLSFNETFQPGMEEGMMTQARTWISRQGEFAKAILNSLIEDIKSERSDWKINTRVVDTRKLIRDAVASLQMEMDKDDIRISPDPGSLPSVLIEADPFKLHIALVNILRNAFAAVPLDKTPQERTITISCEMDRSDLKIALTDRGKGISQEKTANLLTPLYGTRVGLGLELVKKIVEKHGGKLTIEPACPQGTVVTVILPGEIQK